MKSIKNLRIIMNDTVPCNKGVEKGDEAHEGHQRGGNVQDQHDGGGSTLRIVTGAYSGETKGALSFPQDFSG